MTHILYSALAPFEKAIPDTTVRDIKLLLLLPADGSTTTVRGLSALSGVHKPGITRFTAKHVTAGLVSKKADKTDARSVLIALTPKGRKLVAGVKLAAA